ncbi:MAG: single-stranded-DNA-specific exonuclease RecJ [Thermodesulfobacteriota bacterium]|nr:single-stranded-DNA-specific exonuclease RecJ [Thermodesulfobacteriota bacterium]
MNILSPDPGTVHQISRSLRCTPFTAKILVNRGITDTRQAQTFLNATLGDIAPPSIIKDMTVAVERIAKALADGEKILVFGDYDADGITATALMQTFFQATGADIEVYIPHRIMEGYGLKPFHITDLAIKKGVNLIITVDCGSSSHQAAESCRQAGIDLIITDHHQMPDPAPDATAIINPSRPDCPSGLTALSGVGVAFYLIIALRTHLRDQGFWRDTPEPNLKQYCDLVTIGTIADIVPLTGENRIFVKAGMAMINNICAPGIQAIIKAARIKRKPLTAEDVAFAIAPRLNAPGRIDHARTALELLTASDTDQTGSMARTLDKLNTKRRLIEEEISDEIQQMVGSDSTLRHNKAALVLAHRKWHQGVIGIAAARAAKRFQMPVALITVNKDISVGSARSIPGINLYAAFSECADLLEAYGGHAQAAGFKIKTHNIDRFDRQFNYIINRQMHPDITKRVLNIDAELTFNDISEQLLDELEMLQPFGESHPEPLFIARNVHVHSSFCINNRHTKMMLMQPASNNKQPVESIRFNTDPNQPVPKHFVSIAFRLRRNTWNSNNRPQLIIEAVLSA